MQAQVDFNWPNSDSDDRLSTYKEVSQISDPKEALLESMLQESDEWAQQILKDANLPSSLNKIRDKFSDLEEGSTVWYAANSLLQAMTLRSALKNGDQETAILLGFLLTDFRWQGYFAALQEQEQVDEKLVEEILNDTDDQELEKETYQAAINALQKKYPHCTTNALRLLLCKQFNVSKQHLDDLDITPDK